jgi:hypothetical protein
MLPPKKLVFNSILCLFIVVFGGQIQAQKVSKKTNPKVVIDTKPMRPIITINLMGKELQAASVLVIINILRLIENYLLEQN